MGAVMHLPCYSLGQSHFVPSACAGLRAVRNVDFGKPHSLLRQHLSPASAEYKVSETSFENRMRCCESDVFREDGKDEEGRMGKMGDN